MSLHQRARLKHGFSQRYGQLCCQVANSIDKPGLNDGMFVQIIGAGQESRVLRSHILTANRLCYGVVWSISSLRFMQFWKKLRSECTVKAKGQNSDFSRENGQIS